MASQGTYQPQDDEDTIELELTAEEMLGLSQAAKEHFAATAEPVNIETVAAKPSVQAARKQRFALWPIVLAVILVGIAAGFAWRPRAPRPQVQQLAPAPAVRSTPPLVVAPAGLPLAPEPQASPVRVKNPFDPKEVFEFPAGTSKAEARQKVSQLLLQRAIDRGGPRRYRSTAAKRAASDNR